MAKVVINNVSLDKIKMRLKKSTEYSICKLMYPEHRVKLNKKGDELTMKLPPLLALALYHQRVLPQNKDDKVSIKQDGKDLGMFCVIDLAYPDELYDDGLTEITFKVADKK